MNNFSGNSYESLHRFAALVESSADAIFATTIQGIITDWNAAAERMYGYSPEEAIGKPVAFIAPPELLNQSRHNTASLAEGNHVQNYETVRQRKDGTCIDVSLTLSPIIDDAGIVLGISAIHRDISERKRVEIALRENEERYRELVQLSPDGIMVHSDGKVVFANPSLARILAFESPEQMIDMEAITLAAPEEQEGIREHRKRADAGDRTSMEEARFLRADGSETYLERVMSLVNWDGKPSYLVIFRDVNERRKAEKLLLENEAQMRLLLDAVPAQIAYIDREFIYQFANQAYADWHGRPLEQIIGSHLIDVRGQEWFDQFQHDTQRTLAGEMTSVEAERQMDDGRHVHYRVTRLPHFGGNGEVLGYYIIVLDMTEHVQREEQLRQSQKMEAVGQLTGGIAHEFNNLLMVIVGNLENASKSVSDSAGRKSVSAAMNGAMRAAELTNQLLAFSRKQDLKVEHVDLNALVLGLRDMLERTLGEAVSVGAELADDLWPVLADRSLLESALLNLTLNARDAMSRGGKIQIATSNELVDDRHLASHPNAGPGDYAVLEVADTGSGMAPEVLERVFEPFFTTKDVGEGTGLGLSMTHGFVEQSGGFVDIESQVGHGTSVRLYLPRASEPARNQATGENLITKAPSLNATVLVVEDNQAVRQIVVEILSGLGCAVVDAEDGNSALSRLEECPDIDVLFTDVVLPGGMSGPDIAAEARRKIPGLKVVLTSGYPDGEVDGFPSGDEQPWFIRKPYRKSELAELLTLVVLS
ncbi:MAG: PAS domain S-box protein [Rhodospirillales bacterium]|nr:PAS domain S-box protein [Rhodospirillales bacterium]